ncbi:hypothetical protein LCGC14_1168610, partial [marine sediment metagenome]
PRSPLSLGCQGLLLYDLLDYAAEGVSFSHLKRIR